MLLFQHENHLDHCSDLTNSSKLILLTDEVHIIVSQVSVMLFKAGLFCTYERYLIVADTESTFLRHLREIW